jgi:hypothetical protein
MTMKDIRRIPALGQALMEAGIRLPPEQQDLHVADWVKAAEAALRKAGKPLP